MNIVYDLREVLFQNRGWESYGTNLIKEILKNNGLKCSYILENKRLAQKNYPFLFTKNPKVLELKINKLPREKAKFDKTAQDFIESNDIFHSLTDYPEFLPKKAKLIVSIHDLSFFILPKYRPKKFVRLMLSNLKYVLSNAKAVICFSKATRKLLAEYIKSSGINYHNDIFTIPHGIDKGFFSQPAKSIKPVLNSLRIFKPYLLYVGGLEKDKNIENLIAAFLKLSEYKNKLELILVGPPNKESKSLIKNTKTKINPGIRYLGYVDKESLRCLYSGAELFVSPSLDEGFGLPPLEAVSCQTAVACSKIPAFYENLGRGAFYFNPNNIENIYKVLCYVLKHPKEKRKVLAVAQKKINKLSWEKAAKSTILAYRKTFNKYDKNTAY
ncbi:MAG: glycosyltransferase family 4 protein [Candidatus Omnitrophica bacterium]|jgi:glycosyltransferase involved in cell wall biosynthesis|nr:glycosyltransferase family 4 protein [Candidatus Omnitrophota bacterium]